MPWTTPTLREVRSLVRDAVHASLPGADADVPNQCCASCPTPGRALPCERFNIVDWLALQLLPDTAENEWLDRHGDIGSANHRWPDRAQNRRRSPTGVARLSGLVDGAVVPVGTQLQSATDMRASSTRQSPGDARDARRHRYFVLQATVDAPIRALDPGCGSAMP